MYVDESRDHQGTRSVKDVVGRVLAERAVYGWDQGLDASRGDADVHLPIDALSRIDDAPASDQEIKLHGRGPDPGKEPEW